MNKFLFFLVFCILSHQSSHSNPKRSKCELTTSSLSSNTSRTLEQIEALTSEEFIALIPQLTFKKIEGLPSKKFVKLSSEQITTLAPKLNPGQLWALLRFLSSRQIIALSFNDGLSPKQIKFLITKLIDLARVWFFEPGKLKLEDIKFIDKIISVIRHSLLTKGKTLSHKQVQSFPPEFIKAFSSELFGILP